MSSHHRSHHSSSSSKGKGHSSSSKSKGKKDDWSEITDPEERRRVQNRIAQRKFRDKAKEAKERQERDAENRAHAGSAYVTPNPNEMGETDELNGLPWGSLNLRHVVSKGRAREEEPTRASRVDESGSHYENRSYYGETGHYETPQQPVYTEGDSYYETGQTYYEADEQTYEEQTYEEQTYEEQTYEDQTYYDYRSGSGSGRGS